MIIAHHEIEADVKSIELEADIKKIFLKRIFNFEMKKKRNWHGNAQNMKKSPNIEKKKKKFAHLSEVEKYW